MFLGDSNKWVFSTIPSHALLSTPVSPSSCVSLCPHLAWSVVTDLVQVKGESKISSEKSGSPFLPKMENVLDSLPVFKPEDWLCGHLIFLCECSAWSCVYSSCFKFFILKIQLPSLEYCSGPADLIILSSLISIIISAWSSLHAHLGQRMCVKDTVPPLTGKAHIIGEPNLKCMANVISSFLGGDCQVVCLRFRSGLTVCSSMAGCAPEKCWDRHSLGVSREVCHSVSHQVHQSWTFSLQVCSFVTLCDCQRQSVVCKVFFLIQNCQISEK